MVEMSEKMGRKITTGHKKGAAVDERLHIVSILLKI